jgi:hypothetical protein
LIDLVVQLFGMLLQVGNFIITFHHGLKSCDIISGWMFTIKEIDIKCIRDGDGTGRNYFHYLNEKEAEEC